MPSEGRQTICISTQAGCAVDCQFCLTAQLGLIRNLTPGEILAQVLLPLIEAAGASVSGENVPAGEDAIEARTNVVLMGQGEPLLNFENTFAALRILLDKEGVGLSPKHVTLSTSGVIPGIDRMAKEPVRPKLAISLNASNDEQRDALMPLNKKYPLKDLLAACRRYPLRNWEHITFEYVMLGGVNDAPEDARRVVRLLAASQARESEPDPLESRGIAFPGIEGRTHRRVPAHSDGSRRARLCALFARPRCDGRLRPIGVAGNSGLAAAGFSLIRPIRLQSRANSTAVVDYGFK